MASWKSNNIAEHYECDQCLHKVGTATHTHTLVRIVKEEKIRNEWAGKKWKTNHEKYLFKHRYNINLTVNQVQKKFTKR